MSNPLKSVLTSLATAGVLATCTILPIAPGIGYAVAAAPPRDPGRCGVAVSGPDLTSGGYGYTVYNQCSTTIHVKVHLYTAGRNTACKYIYPGGNDVFFSTYPDQTWQAIAC